MHSAGNVPTLLSRSTSHHPPAAPRRIAPPRQDPELQRLCGHGLALAQLRAKYQSICLDLVGPSVSRMMM
jgi:hypothetical protein